MSAETSIDPARRLDFYFRVKRAGSKKFVFKDADGAAINISAFEFELNIKEYAGARGNKIALTVGSGLTVGGSGNNELTAAFTVANTNINEGEYFFELVKGSTDKTYLTGKAFAHNGIFDGVETDTSAVTITDGSSTVTITLSDTMSAGQIATALGTQSANVVYAGPSSGSAAVPAFRAIVAGDIPAEIARLASPAFTGTPTVPTAAVGTDTTQIASTAYVRANAIVSETSDFYVGQRSFQVPPINALGNGNGKFEIVNIGNYGSSETRNLVPRGIFNIGGNPVLFRNLVYDPVNVKYTTPYQQADAYGSCAFECGGEAAILHATPAGVNFSDVPHEILLASANGTDGPASGKQTSGYYVHIKAPLWARYSSAAYDPASTANSWNPSTATDPLIWLSTGEVKGTSGTHDYLELMKIEGQTAYGVVNFARAGGTHQSKTITTTDAIQGAIGAKGWDGSTWQRTAEIAFHTRGSLSAGNIPMGMLFRSSETNTAGLTTRHEMAPNGNFGFGIVGAGLQTALVHIGASTTTRASLRIVKGIAPTSPNDGDIWYDDAAETLNVRINGVTRTINVT